MYRSTAAPKIRWSTWNRCCSTRPRAC
jgi:hypothetical protein